ncbi:MAG: TVP38/TMEM64 family protein [Ilumatobacter sp.]
MAATIAAFFALGGYGWATSDGNVERLLTETGVVGPLLFVVIMWIAQPFGVPGFVFMAPAGIVWPNPLAIALAWIGNMGASYLAFSFARWTARDWVTVRIPPRMQRYDHRLETGGVWPVVLLRLVFGQLPPADWLLGVTKVSTRNFLIGTGIGIIPGVVIFVIAGGGIIELLRDMPTSMQRVLIASALAIAVGARIFRVRRRRLAHQASNSVAPDLP